MKYAFRLSATFCLFGCYNPTGTVRFRRAQTFALCNHVRQQLAESASTFS
jgi:hypothetical protein